MFTDRIRRRIAMSVSSIGVVCIAHTQTTIDGSNIPVPGLTCVYKQQWFYETHPTMGAAVVWNYGTTPATAPYVIQYHAPEELVGGVHFPLANIGITEPSGQVQFFGVMDEFSETQLGSYHVPSPTADLLSDPLVSVQYPLAYGDAWVDTMVSIYDLGMDTTVHMYDVSAWGTLTIPFGTANDVLLLRSLQTDTTLLPWGTEIDRYWDYSFRSAQHRCPLTMIHIDEFVMSEGEVLSNGVAYWLQSTSLTTDLMETTVEKTTIWPVPASEQFYISSEMEGSMQLVLSDMQGRAVKTIEMKDGCRPSCSLSIAELASGNYTMMMIAKDGSRSVDHIQISR